VGSLLGRQKKIWLNLKIEITCSEQQEENNLKKSSEPHNPVALQQKDLTSFLLGFWK
jgi:hypothetical protein